MGDNNNNNNKLTGILYKVSEGYRKTRNFGSHIIWHIVEMYQYRKEKNC